MRLKNYSKETKNIFKNDYFSQRQAGLSLEKRRSSVFHHYLSR